MKFTVRNKQMKVDEISVGNITRSSLVLIGDSEVITCYSIFDTPTTSLIQKPALPVLGNPLRPIDSEGAI